MEPACRRIIHRGAIAVALCAGAWPLPSTANPTGPTVTAGQASFQVQGNTLTVTNTPGTIIQWQGFSIRADELTRFAQQSSLSAVLNRVTGGSPSEILGRLSSNGRVFLINPSGITFGTGAQIDVGGLVASSLNISDADFLAGRLRFAGEGAGAVRNRGEIRTPVGGSVALIAPQVDNAGVIRAPSGDIVLAAGTTVRLVDAAFPAIQVEVSAPGDRPLNLGNLSASGRVFTYLVRQSGLASASSAQAGSGGRVSLTSAGTVEVTAGARIEANAAVAGRGGEVVLIAEDLMHFAGAIEARAGELSGDGGKTEVSGRRTLVFTGKVDTLAPSGRDGSLLIDPATIRVVAGSTGVPANLGDAVWALAEDPGAQALGALDLAGLLVTTSVTLQASSKIEIAAPVSVAAAAPRTLTLQAPVISVQAPITSTGASLELRLEAPNGSIDIAQGLEFVLGGGLLTVAAPAVRVAPAETQQVPQAIARTTTVPAELAALRAQVEAEIARDNARLAASIKPCGTAGASVKAGCTVATPPRRFVFAS